MGIWNGIYEHSMREPLRASTVLVWVVVVAGLHVGGARGFGRGHSESHAKQRLSMAADGSD